MLGRNDATGVDSNDDVETDVVVSDEDEKSWPPLLESKDAGFEHGESVEVKDASADLPIGIEETADPYRFRIIGGVTGIVDRVNDVVEPGAYTKTLRARTPKIIKDHEWSQRLGKVLSIKELRPGDSELPKTTADGSPWPREAGALIADVQLFKKSQAGQEAAERWREYGRDQQFSIGYRVPSGMAVKSADGVRKIKELDLYEISDVLWGAAPDSTLLPSAMSVKILEGDLETKDVVDPSGPSEDETLVAEDSTVDLAPEDDAIVENTGLEAEDDNVKSDEETEDDSKLDAELDDVDPDTVEDVDMDDDEIDAEAFDEFGDAITASMSSDIERGDEPETRAPSTEDAGEHTADTLHDADPGDGEASDNAAAATVVVDGTDGPRDEEPENTAPSTSEAGMLGREDAAEKALGPVTSHVDLRSTLRAWEVAPDAEKAAYASYIVAAAEEARIGYLVPDEVRNFAGSDKIEAWNLRKNAPSTNAQSPSLLGDGAVNITPPGSGTATHSGQAAKNTTPPSTASKNAPNVTESSPSTISPSVKQSLMDESGSAKNAGTMRSALNMQTSHQNNTTLDENENATTSRASTMDSPPNKSTIYSPTEGTAKSAAVPPATRHTANGTTSTTITEQVKSEASCVTGAMSPSDFAEKTLVDSDHSQNIWNDTQTKYDTAPLGNGDNWVTQGGGLDPFLRAIAHSLIRNGHSKSQAIALAIGSVRRWAAGGGNVTPKTRAKAVKALASWEALKAKAKAKPNVKSDGDSYERQVEEVSGTADRKSIDVPFFQGSNEELRALIQSALTASVKSGEFEGDAVIVATYDAYAIVSVYSGIGNTAYKVDFDYDPDSGVVELGQVQPVRINAATVDAGDDDIAAAIAEIGDDETPIVDSMKAAVTMLDLEDKAGRVLSGANAEALKSAYEALGALLSRAGVDVNGGEQEPVDSGDGDVVTDETDVAAKSDEFKMLELMRIEAEVRARSLAMQ
jgi:hypothetical protein